MITVLIKTSIRLFLSSRPTYHFLTDDLLHSAIKDQQESRAVAEKPQTARTMPL